MGGPDYGGPVGLHETPEEFLARVEGSFIWQKIWILQNGVYVM